LIDYEAINLFYVSGKLCIGKRETTWQTEQDIKRNSPLNTCTTMAGEGGATLPNETPPLLTSTNAPDLRSPSILHVKQLCVVSPGKHYLYRQITINN
jgi:hypothetical protein